MASNTNALLQATGFSAPCYKDPYCAGGACTPDTPISCGSDQYSACQYWTASLANGFLCPPPPPWVSGATDTGAVAGAELGGALQSAPASAIESVGLAASVVPIVGAVGAIIASISGFFGAAHAAAQRAQANALSVGIPGANRFLSQIDAAVSSGSLSVPDAIEALDSLQTQFDSLMRQGTSFKRGDALWVADVGLQMLIAQRKQQYQNSLPSVVGAITGGTLAGFSPWLILVVAGVILILFLRR